MIQLRPLLLASALLLALAASAAAQPMRVYYPDIEQGSATLVVSPTGHALLVDAGTDIKVTEDAIEGFVNDLIDAGIVTSLDYVVATHYDEDHIGRLEHVFYLVPMPPGAIAYDRGTVGGTPATFAYADYADGAAQHNRTTITPGTVLDLGGGVTARCVVVNGELPSGPPVDITASAQFENSASVALLVEHGDVDVWIGGDLTGNPAENVTDVESAVAPFVGDVDVYTFNHHGSKTSSNPTFLAVLKAEIGIIQSSVENDFGHPNAIVVTQFLLTDDSGGNIPLPYQLNPGNPTDVRSDDSLAAGIADCDDVNVAAGDPGTVVLLSDGASYQLRGCGFGTLSLAADTGGGPVGNFAPAILRVSRSPHVPLASEAVTVQAPIVDEGAVTAEIRWTRDGIVQAPIAMSGAGGVFTGQIPAQVDGAAIRFRVAATDALAQTELSPAQGYFSGTTPIATFRTNDADGVLVPKAFGVRIEADVTAEPGVFHPFVTQMTVQDATGGVQVFDTAFLAIARGDRVAIVGDLEQFSGMTELSLAEKVGNVGATVIAPGVPPAPVTLTVAQVGEAREGQLVRLDDVTVVSGTISESGNSALTISDDGGISTLTLRIDGDTDIPGVPTPTLPFDVIGVIGQFEPFSGFPFDGGYQISPRERTDLVSGEINPPALLVNEIHADPAATGGDANGDGVVSSTADEFVELVNTTIAPLDLSGWTLSDAVGVKHVFAAGTVVPAREVVVVFAGGTPTGDFGNAGANGLVFVASTGGLGLNNTGDTVTVRDDAAAIVDTVTYGSSGGQDQSLVRQPDFSNTPFVLHTTATGSGGRLYSPGTRVDGTPATVAVGALLLTEVMYDPNGADSGLEWIELYNASALAIDLSQVCLGAGGADYTSTLVQTSGTVAAGATFVVGGPTTSADNGDPVYDQVLDLSPDLQNSGTDADGVALFNVRCGFVGATTVPIDAVVYGGANTANLIDETGTANAPEVGDAPSAASIGRFDLEGAWQVQLTPDPNVFSPGTPPPPPAGLLLSEVMYDGGGTDDGFEWVEIFNPTAAAVDLSNYSLGAGGTTYTTTKAQLSGTIAASGVFVVGGPSSDATNGNPVYDLVLDFSPDLQNSGSPGDGVALFALPASQVTSATVPIDAVVYGPDNGSGLIDETGVANAPEVADAPAGSSIERVDAAGNWQIQAVPTPGSSPLEGPPPNQAPTVTITAPTNGTIVTEGTPIAFTGTATDPEDGTLTASLAWTSDLDGPIGTGGSFSTVLSVGTHLVTASVTDSGGLPDSDAVTVTVEAPPAPVLVLSEVLYDPDGSDNSLEWVELYNAGAVAIDLSGYSLGAGGSNYTTTTAQLSGTIAPGQTFVVGGPKSRTANSNPTFQQTLNFGPDLENGGATADGVALFAVPAAQITPSTVPIDAVVYGTTNSNNLIDETGAANPPDVGTAGSGDSIERTTLAGAWQVQTNPTPNASPLP